MKHCLADGSRTRFAALCVALALGLPVAATAASHSFTNAWGRWSDASNWDTGTVPNGPDDYAVFTKGGHVTNDVPGLVVDKITIQAETHLYGEPIKLGSGLRELNMNSKQLYFHCPTVIPAGLKMTGGGGANFCNTNTVALTEEFLAGTLNMRVGEFASGTVTNHTFAPFVLRKAIGTESDKLQLVTSNGARAVQDLSMLEVVIGPMSISTTADGQMRIFGQAAPGGVRYTDGNFVIYDSRGNQEGALRIYNGVNLTLDNSPDPVRPASGPVLHLDASRTDSFEYLDGDPAKGIVKWKGVNGYGYAAHDGQLTAAGTRALPTLQLDKLNGMPWVDFGSFYNKSYSPASARANAPYLVMQCGSGTDLNVYTLFIVSASQNFLVGANSANTIIHGNDSWSGALAQNRNETHADFKDYSAWVRMDGADTTAFACKRSGQNKPNLFAIRMANSALKVGRLAWDRTYRTGAAQICEVILYTRKLTDEEFLQTEDYLRQKWYNVPATHFVETGHRADRVYFDASATESARLGVAKDVRAEVGCVGGPVRGKVEGGGTLVTRTNPYQLYPLDVAGATIVPRTEGRAFAPPPTDPIHDTYCHFDADDADSFVLDEADNILEWRDRNYATTGRAAYSPNDAVNPPPVRRQAGLNGRGVVDSGAANSGKVLLFNHTNTTIQAIFLVYARPAGDNFEFLHGDTYRNNTAHFHRGQMGGLFYASGYVADGITKGDVWVNGRRVNDPRACYIPPTEPLVLGINLVSNKFASAAALFVDRWGHPSNGKKFRSGGQILCEAVYYDRYLQTNEFHQVQDWLVKKWLPAKPPAYAAADGEETFGEISSSADGKASVSAIEVPSGSVTTGPLLGDSWTKKGAGTLTANGVEMTGTLTLEEGTLALGTRAPSADYEPPTPAFHVDASRAGDFTLDDASVLAVRDASGGDYMAYAPTNGATVLAPQRVADPALGGKPVIDFGAPATKTTLGSCLLWNKRDTTIRTVIFVADFSNGVRMPFGSSTEFPGMLLRDDPSALAPLWPAGSQTMLVNGRTHVDGCNAQTASYRPGWQVVTWVSTGNCSADAFAVREYDKACSANAFRSFMGGLKLAEALVYDEVVPEAQRREIEAHLMRKWLGTAPKGYAGGTSAVETLNLAGGAVHVPANAALAVGKVTGETGLALSGCGAVSVKDLSRLEGVLGVTNASLNLTGRVIPDASLLPTNGLFAHFDMAATDSLETYELNGTNFVTRWNDLTGQHYAVADPTNRPWILKADCNGLDTLCTGSFVKSTDTRNLPKAGWLNWDNKACHARTVIEVIGVHEGGNFLVAGHDGSGVCVLHRGGAYSGGSYADAILATGRVEPGETLYSENAFYSIDGKKVAYTQGFASPDYHSFAVRCDDTKNPNYFLIGQFGKERNYRWGGQRVCEVLAYDRCLTDDELSRLEAYLQKKWFGRYYEGYGDDSLPAMALGAGGQVDFGGEKRRTAVVTGSGTIANGDVRVTDCFAPEAGFAVEGTVTFVGTEGTVVAPVDEFVGGTEVVLAACMGFEGDPAAWRLVDRAGRELDADMLKARFLYKNGNLVLSLRGRGSLLIVR